jgi:hypothetical protein
MREPITNTANDDEKEAIDQKDSITEHTCACGEKHEQESDEISHREACKSPLKFGNSCCCQSDNATQNASQHCGHGPRCQ